MQFPLGGFLGVSTAWRLHRHGECRALKEKTKSNRGVAERAEENWGEINSMKSLRVFLRALRVSAFALFQFQ
jgi:hypothetical protein